MYWQRFYDENLAHASYLIGCQATGEAIVIDANRDIELYLTAAAHQGFTLRAVTETHIHADYLSGSRELAERCGARLYLSDEGDTDWKYAFMESAGAVPLRNGDKIELGRVTLQARHTPGHTPEHLCFLLTDKAASTPEPVGIFSGDFVFAGDVGRPDLLEKTAGSKNSADAGARQLYRSLQQLRELPDYLQVWPAHGAGSACGKGLGSMPQTTLGYERRTNWAFADQSEASFISEVLHGQVEPPRYFARMKLLNKQGPPPLALQSSLFPLDPHLLPSLLRQKATIVDLRPTESFRRSHARGCLHVPLSAGTAGWVGSLLDPSQPIYLITDEPDRARTVFQAIGLDRLQGYLIPQPRLEAYFDSHITSLSPEEFERDRQQAGVSVIDVRSLREREAGSVPDSIHVALGSLPEHQQELSSLTGPCLLYCQSGVRSTIAISYLERFDPHQQVAELTGGFPKWTDASSQLVAKR